MRRKKDQIIDSQSQVIDSLRLHFRSKALRAALLLFRLEPGNIQEAAERRGIGVGKGRRTPEEWSHVF